MHFLIAEDGRHWPADSCDLAGMPTLRRPPGTAAHTTIDPPDFTSFRLIRGIRAEILLPPGALSTAAFARTAALLVAWQPSTIVITGGPGRPVELLHSVSDALARLDSFRRSEKGITAGRQSSVEDLALDRLQHPQRRIQAAQFRRWRNAHGRLTAASLARMERTPVAAMSAMVAMPGGDRTVIHCFPPTARTIYPPCTLLSLIGRSLADQPDHDYDALTTDGYRQVAETSLPRLQMIDAIVDRPGNAPTWLRYERLLLPWRAPSGARYVSGTAVMRVVRTF